MALSIDKVNYVAGEFIFVDNRITNLTDIDLEIPRPRPDASLNVHMMDAVGGRVRGNYPIVEWLKPPTMRLPPKSKHDETIDLSRFANTRGVTLGVAHLSVGKYKVWVELAGVSSDTIEFTISSPGNRDSALGNKLTELYRDHKSNAEAIAGLSTFIGEYPVNVYTPNAYAFLMTFLSSESKPSRDELKKVSMQFIERFPNHGLSELAVQYYRSALESEAGKMKGRSLDARKVSTIDHKLKELQRSFPNTRAHRFIEDSITKSMAQNEEE